MAASVLNSNKALVSNTEMKKESRTLAERVKEYLFSNMDILVPGILAMNGSYYRPVKK